MPTSNEAHSQRVHLEHLQLGCSRDSVPFTTFRRSVHKKNAYRSQNNSRYKAPGCQAQGIASLQIRLTKNRRGCLKKTSSQGHTRFFLCRLAPLQKTSVSCAVATLQPCSDITYRSVRHLIEPDLLVSSCWPAPDCPVYVSFFPGSNCSSISSISPSACSKGCSKASSSCRPSSRSNRW